MMQKVLKENACCDVAFPFRSGFLAYNTGLISGAFSNYNTASQCEKEIKKLSYSLFQFTDYLLG